MTTDDFGFIPTDDSLVIPTDDSGFVIPTDDSGFVIPDGSELFAEGRSGDWLDSAGRLVDAILLASQRVGLALAAAGFAIAGANMIDSKETLGGVSLGVAAVFGLWILVASIRGVGPRR